MNDVKLKYDQYKNLIKNADVLLFRSGTFPFCIGWWISRYTNSPYSHVAIAAWNGDDVDCLEFRELRSSQAYPLKKYLEEGHEIDVFRVLSVLEHPELKHTHNKGYYIDHHAHIFNDRIANDIVETARRLIGKKYGWRTVLKMALTYIPLVRFRRNHKIEDEWIDVNSFVCSTLITYCYRTHFADPVPFLSDLYTSPGDLARSGLFWKLFTIC